MAKFPLLPGLAAVIMISGEPAPEHDDTDEIEVDHEDPHVAEHQASRTKSVYIEAKTGEQFGVKLGVTGPLGHAKMMYTKLIFEVWVDGIAAGKAFCDRPFFKNGGVTWEYTMKGVTNDKGSKCTLKNFLFAKIETSTSSSPYSSFSLLNTSNSG
jgi:hypothetical protein